MERFKRTRITNDEPVIAIRDYRFYYSATFSKLADLRDKNYVRYYIDDKKMEILMEFLSEKEDDSCYKVGNEQNKKNNFRSSIGAMISHYHLVRKIHNSRDNELKKFVATKRGNLWVIKLRPCFENVIDRKDVNHLANNLKGIYRYLNNQGEVVYIGEGDIKQRVKIQERRDWNFDKIEYSVIDSENDRYYWENYWIEKHKEKNNGKLPYYNLLSGNNKMN